MTSICLCIGLCSIMLKKMHFNTTLYVFWLDYHLLFFCHSLIDCSVLLQGKQTKSQTKWQFPPAWKQWVTWLLPLQISCLWTCALPRSVRLMWTGHRHHCLVALITSWPANWLVSLKGSSCAREVMDGFNECEPPSESSLILAEVNREICDRKIQSVWQWKTFLFLYECDMAFCHEDKTVWFWY